MTVTINNGDGLLLDEEMTTNDEDGIITSTVPVPLDTNCMKISVRVCACLHFGLLSLSLSL